MCIVGPLGPVEAADQLWLTRFVLERVCEDFNVCLSLDPRPINGDWPDAVCRCRFSTADMRSEETGVDAIQR